jgi:5-methylcytosine-specific restriction endonuclease McrA
MRLFVPNPSTPGGRRPVSFAGKQITGQEASYNANSKRWRIVQQYADGSTRRMKGAFRTREEAEAAITPKRKNVTDRAHRYRANRNAPPGPRQCAMCGNPKTVEVEHVDGHEEHGEPHNLMWACRSCNTKKGAHFKRKGAGRRTMQYNPSPDPSEGAKSLAQWVIAVMTLKGQSSEMNLQDAIQLVQNTPANKRSEFAKQIWSRRRRHGTTSSRQEEVPF